MYAVTAEVVVPNRFLLAVGHCLRCVAGYPAGSDYDDGCLQCVRRVVASVSDQEPPYDSNFELERLRERFFPPGKTALLDADVRHHTRIDRPDEDVEPNKDEIDLCAERGSPFAFARFDLIHYVAVDWRYWRSGDRFGGLRR